MPASARRSWRSTTASVRPSSRSASCSPTQTTGRSPCRCAAATFLCTRSSVSPNNARRSEWPRIDMRTPISASMRGEISPVNGPLSSQWWFCAPRTIRVPAIRSATARRHVNGGATATSTSSPAGSASAICSTSATAKTSVMFIFQLPTTRGRRMSSRLVERLDPRQRQAGEELERGTSAGRDVRHLPREPELLDGRGRVAASHDGHGLRRREGLGHPARAVRERLDLEAAERAVPEHGPRRRERAGEQLGRLRPDVDAGLVADDLDPVGRAVRVVLPAHRDDVVHGEEEIVPPVARLLHERLRERRPVLLEERLPDGLEERLEERVRHAAADEEQVDARAEVLDELDLVRQDRNRTRQNCRPVGTSYSAH